MEVFSWMQCVTPICFYLALSLFLFHSLFIFLLCQLFYSPCYLSFVLQFSVALFSIFVRFLFYWNKYEDLLYTRCLTICLCTSIWAKRCFLIFFVLLPPGFRFFSRLLVFFFLSLSLCSFTDSPNYFSAVASELSSFYFLIVSFSCSVQCFLRRFLFKYILYTNSAHTQKKKITQDAKMVICLKINFKLIS